MTGGVAPANMDALADDLDATATGHDALRLRTRTSSATPQQPPYPKESLPSSPATATVEAAVNIREVIEKLEQIVSNPDLDREAIYETDPAVPSADEVLVVPSIDELPVMLAANEVPVILSADEVPVVPSADEVPVILSADEVPVVPSADVVPVVDSADEGPVAGEAENLQALRSYWSGYRHRDV